MQTFRIFFLQVCNHRKVNKQKGHSSRVPTHVTLRIFIMQVLASQLLFLANRNAGQAIPPLFWPVNCIKIGEHVALLSDPTFNCLYCGATVLWSGKENVILTMHPFRQSQSKITAASGNVDQSKPHSHFDSQIDPYISCILIECVCNRMQYKC